MKHVMLDIEVVGNLASIGAVEFDGTGDLKTFHRVIDQTSCILVGLEIDKGSVDFWRKQSGHALEVLLNSPSKVRLEKALADFKNFLGSSTTWLWAKGPDYDCVYLAEAYKACKMKVPWLYRNTRDVRTIMALADVEAIEAEDAHDALSDACAQAATVVKCYQKLGLRI